MPDIVGDHKNFMLVLVMVSQEKRRQQTESAKRREIEHRIQSELILRRSEDRRLLKEMENGRVIPGGRLNNKEEIDEELEGFFGISKEI